jgi:hypothetical protein
MKISELNHPRESFSKNDPVKDLFSVMLLSSTSPNRVLGWEANKQAEVCGLIGLVNKNMARVPSVPDSNYSSCQKGIASDSFLKSKNWHDWHDLFYKKIKNQIRSEFEMNGMNVQPISNPSFYKQTSFLN